MDNKSSCKAQIIHKTMKYQPSMANKASWKIGCGIIGQMLSDAAKVMHEEEV